MKKLLLSLLLMFSFSLFAAPTSETSYALDDDDVIEIDVSYIPPVTGPKRTPAIVPISAACYVELSYIVVNFQYSIGVNGNYECSDFGNLKCSVFSNKSTSFSVTMMQQFR